MYRDKFSQKYYYFLDLTGNFFYNNCLERLKKESVRVDMADIG
ncbi:MAG: hypothetical protein QME51_10040 [Planctomycetota bacterium]|nr:hypothetical protein [Planctomycetota bacterium]